MLGTLTENQINNLLSSQVVGRLACSNNDRPYIVPVAYVFDGHYIYGQSNEGMKLGMLRQNPNVCFEVDCMTDMANWQSVVVKGTFQELKGKTAEKARAALFNGIMHLMTNAAVHKHEHESTVEIDDSNRVKSVMYRIKPKVKSGRFERR